MNSTRPSPVTFFIIQGLVENRMLRTDPKLGSPMYFFLHNLSFMEMVYTTVTVPNMLSGFLTEVITVSVPGCFLHMYCFIQMAVNNHALLTVMAYDCYVAICNSLLYTAVMTQPVHLPLIIGAWTLDAICTSRPLPCAAHHGVLIFTSYILIGVAIAKMGAAQRLLPCGKLLSRVCKMGSHQEMVCIIVSVLYSALTPFMNLIIYSLRNKELRKAITEPSHCRAAENSTRCPGHKIVSKFS
ncbi:olfactory receptor 10J4-like [Salvelinus namaycush]|uniref:Olfactory receptor 10J4-like n=1 Tax=Salvelinus namaycush TaxID=8040 RepID=A0A8U0QJN9_SALNM|nr:olfactory receptor 10J4-like [Salvelinus namaycush]